MMDILKLANSSAMEKEAIAVVSDVLLDKPLTEEIMESQVNRIFNSNRYKKDKVFFIKGNKIYLFTKNSMSQ